MKKTIAIDFDGVIHSYTSGWQGLCEISDPPVPGAFAFLTWAVKEYKVVIFSTRTETEEALIAMRLWMTHHGLAVEVERQLEITNLKPKAGIYLDDRGWKFEGDFPTKEEIEAFKPWRM